MKDISRNRVHQAYSAEGFFQGHFKTHDLEVGFEPTLIVLKTIELTIFLFQIIAVCVFSERRNMEDKLEWLTGFEPATF